MNFGDDDAMPTLRHGIAADSLHRLQELQDIITSRKDSLELWFAALVIKILLTVNRVRLDLLKTMEEETVSGAAWSARNLLELWVWLELSAARCLGGFFLCITRKRAAR